MSDPQFDLFDLPPGARNTDPDTSHAAAERTPSIRRRDRRLVLCEHGRCPNGLTDFELAEHLNRQQTSVGKGRGELRDLGLIYDTGLRRPAPSGAGAIVWALTDDGLLRRSEEAKHELRRILADLSKAHSEKEGEKSLGQGAQGWCDGGRNTRWGVPILQRAGG
jgi:hypothetical protein